MLSSLALEELAISHMDNSEAEKLDYVLTSLPNQATLSNLADINRLVLQALQTTLKEEILLQFKLEQVIDFLGVDALGFRLLAQSTPTEIETHTEAVFTLPMIDNSDDEEEVEELREED